MKEEDIFTFIWDNLYKLCDEKITLGLNIDLDLKDLHRDILYNWILLPLWLTLYIFLSMGWTTDVFPVVELSEEMRKLPKEEWLPEFLADNFYQVPLDINKADLNEVFAVIDFEKDSQRLRVIYLYPSVQNINKIANSIKDKELYYIIIPWPHTLDIDKIKNCKFLVSSIVSQINFDRSEDLIESMKDYMGRIDLSGEWLKIHYYKEVLRTRKQVINKIRNILEKENIRYKIKELSEIINETLSREPDEFKKIWISVRDSILGDLELWVYEAIAPVSFQGMFESEDKRKIFKKYYEKFMQVWGRLLPGKPPALYESIVRDVGSIFEKFLKEYFNYDERYVFSYIINDLFRQNKISMLMRSELLTLNTYYNVAKHSTKEEEITEENAHLVLNIADHIFSRLKPRY